MRKMAVRKYGLLLALLVLLMLLLTLPVGSVGATVYCPPSPLPRARFSLSGTRVLAGRMPGQLLIPGYDGGTLRVSGAWDMDQAAIADMMARTKPVMMNTVGNSKALAKSLPAAEQPVMQISKQMAARLDRAAEDCNCLWDKARPASDNAFYIGCVENAVTGILHCYQ